MASDKEPPPDFREAEAPRFTSALKLKLQGEAASTDATSARGRGRAAPAAAPAAADSICYRTPLQHLSSLLARRNAAISALPAVTSSSGSGIRGGDGSSTLDWPMFAGPFSGSGEPHVRAVRKTFFEFTAIIKDVLPDESSSDDIHAAAHSIYCTFARATGASAPAATGGDKLIASTAGSILATETGMTVEAEVLLKLVNLTLTLRSWRIAHGVTPELLPSPAPAASAPLGRAASHDDSVASLRDGASALLSYIQSCEAHFTPLLAAAARAVTAPTRPRAPGPRLVDGMASMLLACVKRDALWLLSLCMNYTASSASAAGAGMTGEALATTVLDMFVRHRGAAYDAAAGAALQSDLYGLLGDDALEFMGELMQHSSDVASIKKVDVERYAAALEAASSGAVGRRRGGDRAGGTAGYVGIGPGVSVTSAADVAAERQRQKADRRADRSMKAMDDIHARVAAGDKTVASALVAAGFDPAYIAQESALGLASDRRPTGSMAPPPTRGRITVDEAIAGIGGGGFGGAPKQLLPLGTVTVTRDGYEEVSVPPPTSVGSATHDSSKLIAIDTLHPLAQATFRGIKRLNRLQSELFHAAYDSNENLLVCAPTGAGKTNVAMLTVCRELLNHLGADGRVRRDEFKIVYVAPMKALAQEVVAKFSERLSGAGLVVRELTGDMQLTKKEIAETQVIVTTPEKWDVITRKAGDGSLVALVRLLIIDEVHLLADERGAVIESIVARTLRLVETSQSVIRIVGLSATLPNYKDVGTFLRVNPATGLFYFNDAYRPVPLQQVFIGVTEKQPLRRSNMMNKIAFEKAMASIRKGKQVMVFVHSRKDTVKTARALRDFARADGSVSLLSPFSGEEAEDADAAAAAPAVSAAGGRAIQGEGRLTLNASQWLAMQRDVEKSRNMEVQELFRDGFGIHHAGMLRPDRGLSERMFAAGVVKILVCTATLAWGVNLPAHTVIIKGTQIYDAEAGGFNDLGMLDVMQIFGRAGRPQFDTSGEGIIITSHDKLQHYLHMLMHALPIESSFIKALPDHLNAEIVSGTVTNVREAIAWLSYTYLHVRMLRNPLAYGIPWDEFAEDPDLHHKRIKLIVDAAKRLDACRMIRYDEHSTNFAVTDLGRVASHYYVYCGSIETFNAYMEKVPTLTDGDVLDLITRAEEFKNIKVRDEELPELDYLRATAHVKLKGEVANTTGKTNILLQAFISRIELRSFTLISDMGYINQSAGRIARALFEIFLRKGWCTCAERFLTLSKCIDKRLWWDASPLWQFADRQLPADVVKKLEVSRVSLNDLCDMDAADLGALVHLPKGGGRIRSALDMLPFLDVDASVQPITRGILRVAIKLAADFAWTDGVHGSAEPYWLWVEDGDNEHIYHSESILLHKRQALSPVPITITFSIPVFEPLPAQYWVRVVSDRWLGVETLIPLSFRHLVLPERTTAHTDLLDLMPLPVSAMRNPSYEALYTSFSHFNPIQTQVFHTLYHTDVNVLLGAPTGSGKTVAAELALLRMWNAHAGAKAVYIAPLKALVSERVRDWRAKLQGKLGKQVVELTGDVTPDMLALKRADVIITTPEKWDGISRSWRKREYVQEVALVIIDEIHLLGEDRGPVLEVIVSRMRYIASRTARTHGVRFVGLSTALANARDLADWLGIDKVGLYNFRPSVRPIPMTAHLQGFPGKAYCPRMASMNKPAYAAITTYSPEQPALIFVSSRRQTRLTALELIALCSQDEHPRRFLRMPETEIAAVLPRIKDSSLRHTLEFGVGIHHAGLAESDRSIVEELYVATKIQVLVCTSTLAWGVNFPAHLVIVKGTEYFDAKTSRYVDYPITDVLQMMGRAGRPQFDTTGVAVILVHEAKKNFYKKFLYEPFPVESHLREQLTDHINAEIVGGSIRCMRDALEYVSWTYFFRRLLVNPNYYDLEDASPASVQAYLTTWLDSVFADLEASGCICRGDEAIAAHAASAATDAGALVDAVAPCTLGYIASFYYLHHASVRLFANELAPDMGVPALCQLMCDATEFDELPVRHNEEDLNEALAARLPWRVTGRAFNDPHLKAFLLLQARFTHAPLPITDYINDTKSVMDQALRVLNAMIDIAADDGLADTALALMSLVQCIVQARLPEQHCFMQLPRVTAEGARELQRICSADSLTQLCRTPESPLRSALTRTGMTSEHAADVLTILRRLPRVTVAAQATVTSDSVTLQVTLTAESFRPADSRAYTPMFSKGKDWGWWLVVTDDASNELLAVKRVPHAARGTHTLELPDDADAVLAVVRDGVDARADAAGSSKPRLTVRLVSDCMAGLDVSMTPAIVRAPSTAPELLSATKPVIAAAPAARASAASGEVLAAATSRTGPSKATIPLNVVSKA